MSTREILFRGKRVDNGEWVEGYYMYHINRTICPAGDSVNPDDEEHIILFDGFSDWNMPRGINYKHVLQKTVCQYTGLTDKNGRKIFEGDVLEFTDSEFGKSNYIVIWNQIEWGIRSDLGNVDDLRYWVSSEWEVIGNIFDNPELLN